MASLHPNDEKSMLSWVVRVFTPASLALDERLRRCQEEMAELCQAGGLPEDMVHKIVTRTYQRPKGELQQEIAGCGFTLIALCGSLGLNFADLILAELDRVLAKPVSFFRKKQAEKAKDGTSMLLAYDD